jgi:diphthamide biosynthesis methyltransferase
MTPKDDIDLPVNTHEGSATNVSIPASSTLPTIPTGPITRSRAKKIQQEKHTLIYEFQLNTNENFMLPKSCMLILLRFTKKEGQNISRANQREELCSSQSSATEPSKRNSRIF